MRKILFIILGVLLATQVHAQAVPDPIQITVTPETPAPGEQVQITLEGVGAFLGDAMITWKENGVAKLTGAGERVYTFTAGVLGSQTRIDITINSQVQGIIERALYFRPSTVELLWEADTTVPLFSKNKPLYSAGAQLKVVAFPNVVVNNSLVAPQSLSFQWSRNDTAAPAQSGLGRNTFTFEGDQLKPAEIVTVDVYFGGTRVGSGAVNIPAVNPVLVMYNRDPLRGLVIDQAFPSAIALTGKEITIQAEPYYFSRSSNNAGLLQYTWNLNGEEIVGPDTARGILTLRQSGEGAGGATIQINLTNNDPERLLQTTDATLQILFGQSNGAFQSFFGL